MANSVDFDEAAHHEPLHEDLHRTHIQLASSLMLEVVKRLCRDEHGRSFSNAYLWRKPTNRATLLLFSYE